MRIHKCEFFNWGEPVKHRCKFFILLVSLLSVGAISWAMSNVDGNQEYSWRYKMTVTIETPEGDVSGSAVREMGDNYQVTFPSEASNYGEVAGEAVVVDLGARGVLFVLISSDSDSRFYYTFPVPQGAPETPEGYKYYASLPVGTTAEMPLSSAYPRFVMFTDMDDPKSVALVYARGNCRRESPKPKACESNPKGSYAKVDRFAELFGEGVKLKNITLEITDEPTTWGIVEQYLPESFWNKYREWMKSMDIFQRGKTFSIGQAYFKQGGSK